MSAANTGLISQCIGGFPRWKWCFSHWRESLVVRCSFAECARRGKFRDILFANPAGHSFEGRWYCSAACLQAVLRPRLHCILSGVVFDRARTHRFPIGSLLIHRGVISQHQLREAISRQREAGEGRLGEWLCRLDFISEHQLTTALAQQWGCPTYPLEHQPLPLSFANLVPLKVLESACAVVVHASPDSSAAHVTFGERLDFTTLYAIEGMLNRRTVASLATRSSVERALGHLKHENPSQDPTFDSVRDPAEMAGIVASYAGELQAFRISIARAATYIWVRFQRKHSTRDLLFRIQAPSTMQIPPQHTPKVLLDFADRQRDGVSGATTHL